MGDARRNLGSPQYAGPLPEYRINAQMAAREVPNEAGRLRMEADQRQAHDDGAVFQGSKLRDFELDVAIEVMVAYQVPMRTLPEPEWPVAFVPVRVMSIPLVDLKKTAKAAFEQDKVPGVNVTFDGGDVV